ncbi:DUF2612 domain-containing protein [Vibrio phage vB_VpaM_VPs20]|uniref:DUF2612 domain-containing protein n=1 Tax=Vibrio phage vB_VpaM_VPs20 TaxID=2978980 RepID=A0A9X9JPR6_9CAUD|nr:DUF2612 domain-containing protein [Vibrio phage vB_VpaM_VPs20]UYD72132.1 DUF2612 domain-containing protein [Vibrio phage vB_VpaM_VPs20]
MAGTLPLPSETLHGLLLTQYRDSPNLIKYFTALSDEQEQVQVAIQETISDRYYDVAEGVQLDVIGRIVGCERVLRGIQIAGNFGYYDVDEALGMGKDADESVGGVLRSDDDDEIQDIVLPDVLFRNWIDARIIKNRTVCNVEDVIAFFRLLLDSPTLMVQIQQEAPATARVTLHTRLSLRNVALLKATAQHVKPVGVNMIVEDLNGEIGTDPVRSLSDGNL